MKLALDILMFRLMFLYNMPVGVKENQLEGKTKVLPKRMLGFL